MSDYLLLRFRELTAGIETIPAHNKIVKERGHVLWGWWKKPPELTPDPALTMLAKTVNKKNGDRLIFFVNSADGTLYEAPLSQIFYEPGGPELKCPEPEHCPQYYREKTLAAWFRVGKITKSKRSLDTYVFSSSNRTALDRSETGISRSHIHQVVADVAFLDSNVSLWFITPIGDIEFSAESQAVRPLSRGVWPAKGGIVLHLSDLHFGVEHAFRNELASSTEPRLAKQTLSEAIIDDLRAARVDLNDVAMILISGDLTWSGDAHEFENARQFIARLRNACGLHISQVVVVPGNHDIEWRDGKGDVSSNAELNYASFSRALYGTDPDQTFVRVHEFVIAGRPVVVVGLNSCRIESRENAGLGFVGREQLNKALTFLSMRQKKEELKIAMLHHHLLPVNYVEDFDAATKRVSLTLDAEAVVRSLISAGVHIVLHGHQHQPYIAQIRRIIEDFVDPFDFRPAGSKCLDGSLWVLGGGSIGVSRRHVNVIGRNSYNIIDLRTRSTIVLRARIQSSAGPGFSDYQLVNIPA
jgi:predicted phosphodiesterase